jgi:hypothetical protein
MMAAEDMFGQRQRVEAVYQLKERWGGCFEMEAEEVGEETAHRKKKDPQPSTP